MRESTEWCAERPEIVVIGGSAGSVQDLLTLAPEIPAGLGIPMLVVIHRKRNEPSLLSGILDSRLPIKVQDADEKEEVCAGMVHTAPPDYHLLIEEDRTFALADTELVKHSRPSIDVTFASVAEVYRTGAVAILLSGANDDGSAGLRSIRKFGGRAIAQDPEEAEFPTMPQVAIETVDGCEVMGRAEMRALLRSLPTRSECGVIESGRGVGIRTGE